VCKCSVVLCSHSSAVEQFLLLLWWCCSDIIALKASGVKMTRAVDETAVCGGLACCSFVASLIAETGERKRE